LLERPEVLAAAAREWAAKRGLTARLNPASPLLLDSVFWDEAGLAKRYFKKQIKEAGRRLGIAYDASNPRQAKMARDLVRFFVQVSALSYDAERPVTNGRIERMFGRGEYFGLLAEDAPLEAQEHTIVSSRNLVEKAVAVLGWRPFLNLAQVALLMSQIEDGLASRHVLDADAVNSAIVLVTGELLATEAARLALARAA
jgi:hypothetical protein